MKISNWRKIGGVLRPRPFSSFRGVSVTNTAMLNGGTRVAEILVTLGTPEEECRLVLSPVEARSLAERLVDYADRHVARAKYPSDEFFTEE